MRIRYSEMFWSFQGEAELAGTPSVWLRFFGCNLECNGFGQDHPTQPDTWELPYKDFDLIAVDRLENLPVWNKGCDSSYSWSNKFKHLAKDTDVDGACDQIESLLPLGKFTHPISQQENMLSFTGGEPMLQQKQMKEIVNTLVQRGNIPKLITVETNGTKKLNKELQTYINEYLYDIGVRWHWAISPKLFNTSGEVGQVLVDTFMSYIDSTKSTGIIKFVCNGSEESWQEIEYCANEIRLFSKRAEISTPDIWIMPVGATKEEQENVESICNSAMQKGYKVATRNHCYVYGNKIGT
jgi:6-pyruvoyltetrahydropterin 2'-reductase